MAQTKKRRRRKHRGTQGGSIDTSGRRGPRPRSRAEARAQARAQMSRKKKGQTRRTAEPRGPVPPSWSTAVKNAGVGAVLFFGVVLLFKQPLGAAAAVAAVMFVFYIPMTYTINRFFYNRRMLREQRARLKQSGRS